jgi:hypothetical protein
MTVSTLPALPPVKPNLWPLRLISLLLTLQAASLLALGLVWVRQVDWLQDPVQWPASGPVAERLLLGLLLLPVACFLLLTAVGVLFRQRAAWLTAMLAQGFILFNGLSNYFADNSTLPDSHLFYLILLSAILMVLYLNSNEVRRRFTLHHALLAPPPLTESEFERLEIRLPTPVENRDEPIAH